MGFFYSVLGFLIAIGVLVAVHEFGHFWVARKLGVKVLKFSIGFGKPLWRRVGKVDQTEYVIAAIPLGGYVKMLGENDPEAVIDQDESHRAFDNQPIWKRTLIVAAGPAINFLFAILLFAGLGLMDREAITPVVGDLSAESAAARAGVQAGDRLLSIDDQSVEYFSQHDLYVLNQVLQGDNLSIEVARDSATGETVRRVELDVSDIPIYNINPSFLTRTLGLVPVFPEISTSLQRVVDGSPADLAGIQVGDEITGIDGQIVASWRELVSVISAAGGRELLVTVNRGDSSLRLAVTPEAIEVNGQTVGRIGVGPTVLPYSDEQRVLVQRSLPQAALWGAEQTWLMSTVTLRMLWKMVTLQVSHKNISGPITIADYAGQAIQIGLDSYVYILAVISISLGVMNLLPIPMLDGGHLLMYAVEVVGGKNISERMFAVGQRVGIMLLICLMSLAFYNDIFRLLN